MRKFALCLGLVLAILAGNGRVTQAADQAGLVAIDILLLPDRVMADRARALNRRLLQDWPTGFALDATHVPHVTLLQCYVRVADLAAVEGAVDRVLQRARPPGMPLTAVGLFDGRVATVGVTGISVGLTPRLSRLQTDMAAAVAPFIRRGGTAAAFVDAPATGTIRWTVDYVDNFRRNSSGANYRPHVTGGVASPAFVDKLTSERFQKFRFKIEGAAIYQLGDVGTARKQLWVWRPN